MRAGEPSDDAQFERLLTRCVDEVVHRQAETGIDLVSDGEFGKTISWSRYILERLNGFEDRPDSIASGDPKRPLGPRTDVEQFPEFYAEYNKTQGFEDVMRNPVCVGPISYAGQEALQRDIANIKAAVDAAQQAGTRSPPSYPWSPRRASPTSARTCTMRPRRSTCTPSPRRCATSTGRSSTPG